MTHAGSRFAIQIRHRFSASGIDPALTQVRESRELAAGLLAAAPPSGWPAAPAGVLTRRHALAAVAAAHLDLERDGIDRSRIRLVREADVRYAGQSMEVRVPAPSGPIDGTFVAGLVAAFHAAHLKTFGYNYAGQQKVELVNFCVSGFGVIDRPSIPKVGAGTGVTPTRGGRAVYFSGAFRETPIYQRAALPAGFRLDGPAVVEEFGSTTVVFPGQHLEVDAHGILIVRPARRAPEAVR